MLLFSFYFLFYFFLSFFFSAVQLPYLSGYNAVFALKNPKNLDILDDGSRDLRLKPSFSITVIMAN